VDAAEIPKLFYVKICYCHH